MKTSEIQKRILTETGLKTSVKKHSKGSMKGYVKITPMFQNGCYPTLPFDFVQKLKVELAGFDYANKPVFCSISCINIYQIEDDRIEMKKEKKPKELETTKISKGWGSKNSQVRLDKVSARNAKKILNGGVAKY